MTTDKAEATKVHHFLVAMLKLRTAALAAWERHPEARPGSGHFSGSQTTGFIGIEMPTIEDMKELNRGELLSAEEKAALLAQPEEEHEDEEDEEDGDEHN